MSRTEQDRLRDVRDATEAIQAHLADHSDQDSQVLHDALLFQFVVIGEAVKNLTPQTRQMFPEIPWSDIAGLRDLIAHEYFRIDIDRILEIVKRDLPPLEAAVQKLLG